MTGVGYAELFWFFVVALGAALAIGTGAALRTYRRTGAFPGEPEERAAGGAAPVPWAVGRVVVGVLLAVVGVAGLLAT